MTPDPRPGSYLAWAATFTVLANLMLIVALTHPR